MCVLTKQSSLGQTLYHTQLPRDQWVYLPVTNIVNDGGIGLTDDLPFNTFSNGFFVVPTNSNVAQINYQIYEYVPQTTDLDSNGNPPEYLGAGTDAVYWDDAQLIQMVPPRTIAVSNSIGVSGRNLNMTVLAGAGLYYSVLYKTNLTDAAWIVLTNGLQADWSWQTNILSVGTNYPIVVTDPVNAAKSRFYRVQVQ